MSEIEQDGIEQGGGNVFADLGTPDPAATAAAANGARCCATGRTSARCATR